MSFRLVSKLVTSNDLERRNGRYFALFQRILVAVGAHSRSLSHLLVSSCSSMLTLAVLKLHVHGPFRSVPEDVAE